MKPYFHELKASKIKRCFCCKYFDVIHCNTTSASIKICRNWSRQSAVLFDMSN